MYGSYSFVPEGLYLLEYDTIFGWVIRNVVNERSIFIFKGHEVWLDLLTPEDKSRYSVSSKRRELLIQRHSVLSQKTWILM